MEPIRVLNVIGEMSPGGIETLIMNIYRNIDRSKVQFDFLQHSPSNPGSFNDEIQSMGGRIYEMPFIKTMTKTYYWKIFEYVKALKTFFIEHQEYHVIHGHMTNTAAIYMPIAKKYGNVTCCIAHSHLTQARPGMVGYLTDILHKPLPKIATDYFACSEMAAHWIFPDEAVRNGKVKIIKNGVDPSRFRYNKDLSMEAKKELKLNNRFIIGNVARFKKEKNHTFQIDIINELIKMEPQALLLLIGDGELRKTIEEKVAQLDLSDNVRFMGIRSDIPKLMLAMDMFLLPSLYEGLPVVGIEAQAMGLPVLTSTGVTKETDITGNVTFLDLKESPKYWAETILKIKNTFARNDMYNYIKDNGYDITATAKWLEDFYIKKHNQCL